MNTDDAIQYLTHVDWRTSRLGLSRMVELLDKLGNPERKLKFVHVAGSNGKGSVCAMLSGILRKAGYTTGLYTSPFISRFNERIQVNGADISDGELVAVTDKVKALADAMEDHPSEFELITVIALLYFLERDCDIVVLEVGLGGRLDATNIIPAPEVVVITPISLEHTAELGDTIDKIAAEKAGIIKPGCRVVSSPQLPAAEAVLRQVCAELSAPLTFVDAAAIARHSDTLAGQRFDFGARKDLRISLLGAYQPENAAAVLTAVDQLSEAGWEIGEEAVREGLAETRWPARFEVVHQNPAVVVDGGHNPQCVDSIVANLNTYFSGQKVVFINGVMADKDYETMFLPALPLAKRVFTVTPDNPRALPAAELAAYFNGKGVAAQSCDSIEQAIRAALDAASEKGVICAFGSFFMAGAIRGFFGLDG